MIASESPSTHHVRAFCVGQAKSGTGSLAAMLARDHRVAHEPERSETLDLIRRVHEEGMPAGAIRDALLERDRRLRLDYDIAWANQFLLPHLVTVFPQARFVVLIREPASWLGSIIGHLLSRTIPDEVRGFLDWWFRPDEYPGRSDDERLIASGLYSIDAFLAAWVRHIDTCLMHLPEDRRLIVRTYELSQSLDRLASFLGTSAASLDTSRIHHNRSTFDGDLAEVVDPAHVQACIDRYCQRHIDDHFTEAPPRPDTQQQRTPHD